MKTLRFAFVAVLLGVASSLLSAQVPSSGSLDGLHRPAWNAGIFVGGSMSVASNPSGQSAFWGVRVGRVLTKELGPGMLRGTFEMAADIIPVDEFWIDGAQYAGGINPLILKWNFTRAQQAVPYAALVGGVLFSSRNLPPGDTARVNFTSGAEFGLQWLCGGRDSISFAVKPFHLSNASIGNRNPGLNANLQFMAVYTWR